MLLNKEIGQRMSRKEKAGKNSRSCSGMGGLKTPQSVTLSSPLVLAASPSDDGSSI